MTRPRKTSTRRATPSAQAERDLWETQQTRGVERARRDATWDGRLILLIAIPVVVWLCAQVALWF